MKIRKSDFLVQRRLLDNNLKKWLDHRLDRTPPSGWIKAIRGALGMTSRQIAERLGVSQSTYLQYETAEKQKTISLDTLSRVAEAMECKLVYALVPNESHGSLEGILHHRAEVAAQKLFSKVRHTMALEDQAVSEDVTKQQIQDIIKSLKEHFDPLLWSDNLPSKTKRQK